MRAGTVVRGFEEGDAAWATDRYAAAATVPGRTRWSYVSPERMRYFACLDFPERGEGWVVEAAGQKAFATITVKAECSGEGEVTGPYPENVPGVSQLLDAIEATSKARGIRLTVWISSEDRRRLQLFKSRGYRRDFALTWLRHGPAPIGRSYASFRSPIEAIDGKTRSDDYLAIYNEGFAGHVGDTALTLADMKFRLADPIHERSRFFMAVLDGEPAGIIEFWPDYDPDSASRVCWLTNIVVRQKLRVNVEVLLALVSRGAAEMTARSVTGGKGLFDTRRSQLMALYALAGASLYDDYECWTLDR